jgi:hypothetical protein
MMRRLSGWIIALLMAVAMAMPPTAQAAGTKKVSMTPARVVGFVNSFNVKSIGEKYGGATEIYQVIDATAKFDPVTANLTADTTATATDTARTAEIVAKTTGTAATARGAPTGTTIEVANMDTANVARKKVMLNAATGDPAGVDETVALGKVAAVVPVVIMADKNTAAIVTSANPAAAATANLSISSTIDGG